MKFKGGPDDRNYRRKVMELCENRKKISSAFREALRKKVFMFIDLDRKNDEEMFKKAFNKDETPKEPKLSKTLSHQQRYEERILELMKQ